jgi:hypothetical protein
MGQENTQWRTFRILLLDFRVPITYYIVSYNDIYSQFKQCPQTLVLLTTRNIGLKLDVRAQFMRLGPDTVCSTCANGSRHK